MSLEKYSAILNKKCKNSFLIDVVRVDQVHKESLTGIASVFHAVCLGRGLDPSTVRFDYQSLKRNLVQCLECGSFNMVDFKGSQAAKAKVLFEIPVNIYCHCNIPELDDVSVECSMCKRWYHGKCEKGDFANRHWKCKSCRKIAHDSIPNLKKRRKLSSSL